MRHTNLNSLGKLWLLSFKIIYFFSSCYTIKDPHHFAYAPSGVNAPFLKEENQLRISGNLTIGENDEDSDRKLEQTFGINLKTAYAITNHFGITAAYFYGKERDKYNSLGGSVVEATELSYRRNAGEIGVGYFSAVDSKQKCYVEIYGGYSKAKNSIRIQTDDINQKEDFYNNKHNLFYIQPGITIHHKNLFQAGVFLRTSLVKFGNASTSYGDEKLKNNYVRLFDLDKHNFIFFQPAVSVRAPLSKTGRVHFNAEINGSFQLSGPDIYYRKSVILIGLTYSPALKK